METKNEKFARLASARTQAILEQIRVFNHLSNTSNYEYDAVQVQELFKILEKNIRSSKRLFLEGIEKQELKKMEKKDDE